MTNKEIANEAGVSIAPGSRVLKNHSVSGESLTKVEADIIVWNSSGIRREV